MEPIVPTPIRVQQLGNDGVTLMGSPTTILDNEGQSDQGLIEAPDLQRVGDTWYLFFSANCYTTENYNVNYATASSITGPFTRAERPLFQTGDFGLVAPGGADVDHDGRHMVFHARQGDNGDRAMHTALVNFDGTTVSANRLSEDQSSGNNSGSNNSASNNSGANNSNSGNSGGPATYY